MPNAFALFVLVFSTVPVVLAVATLRPSMAAAVIFLGTHLFLPEKSGFTFSGLPTLDKHALPSLAAFTAFLVLRPRLPFRAGVSWPELLLGIYIASALAAILANTDPIHIGTVVVSGHHPVSSIKELLTEILHVAVPFILGRACFRSRAAALDLLKVLVFFGLIYSLFFLFEVRMSPQLHKRIYGFHQHPFTQTLRGEGYRPMVFLRTGLVVAIFNMTTALAAWLLVSLNVKLTRRWTFRGPAAYLTLVVAVGRSLGSQLFTAFGTVLILFFSPRIQAMVAVGLTALMFTYPVLRTFDVIDTEAVVATVGDLSESRALSLEFRFDNEDLLLDRALERPFFGWGGFCRPCIWDPVTGDRVSVADGEWIVRFGQAGAFGFLAFFALITGPLVLVFRSLPRVEDPDDRKLLSGMVVIVALSVADLIPNSLAGGNPVLIMIVGALYSLCEVLPDPNKQVEDRPTARLAEVMGMIQAARDRRRARRLGSSPEPG